jgi:lysozyme family protein
MTDDEIVAAVLKREGVYDHDPVDRGGETAYGISKKYHPHAWKDGPPTRDAAIAIYKRDYVAPFASVEPTELKAQVVDIAVNSGVITARGLLARAKQQTERPVGVQLTIERLKHYARLVKADPTQSRFVLGWINRAVSFL